MTLTDTGPMIALIDDKDRDHVACEAALPRLSPPLVTTWPCYTEAMHFLGKSGGHPFQEALWRLRAAGRLIIHELTEADGDRMRALMAQFRDAPMDPQTHLPSPLLRH